MQSDSEALRSFPGVTGHLTAGAVHRGLAAVTDGKSFSLARPVVTGRGGSAGAVGAAHFEGPGLQHDVRTFDRVSVGYDWLGVASHGIENTHLDGLNHIGLDGTWFGGVPVGSTTDVRPSISDWATSGLVTRGVFLDIPAMRNEPFVRHDNPVTGDELAEAIDAADVALLPGDALLLYLGRDKLEQEASSLHAAVSKSAADWIAASGAAVVCWDLLDAPVQDRIQMTVHLLLPSIGLALVDNCDFSTVASYMRNREPQAGLLTVAPLNISGATGCLVNPILLL